MERWVKFKLFYHRSGYIEVGKFEEEQYSTYCEWDTKDTLNTLLDLLCKGSAALAWGFSFGAYSRNGQIWTVERTEVDRKEHTFTVTYSERWNITDAPRRMKRSDVINDIILKVRKENENGNKEYHESNL